LSLADKQIKAHGIRQLMRAIRYDQSDTPAMDGRQSLLQRRHFVVREN